MTTAPRQVRVYTNGLFLPTSNGPVTAYTGPQSSTHTLSGLSCPLNMAKLNYDVMHGLSRSLII